MKVNYIKHLEAVFNKINEDERLTTSHLSLYYSLFHMWNLSKFNNPISICRSEQMKLSKIGSANTYTRCLKQLDEWGYIQYLPSYNPLKGSLVNLYNFDNSTDKGCDNSSGNSCDKGSDNGSVRVVRPSINSLNNINKETIKHTNKEKVKKNFFHPPQLSEVKDFFLEIKSTQDQAEQFHNHFQSNGWLVGGKAKMKDWKAAAKNWVKRAQNFRSSSMAEKSKNMSAQDRLHTNQNKDYNIPL